MVMRLSGFSRKVLFLAAIAMLSVGAAGCKRPPKLIEKVGFKFSDNLEVARISLVFTDKVQSDLSGGFTLKDYGYLFINPYTQAQPFEVGFDLNTAIVNDQDYIKLTPTTVLPNGVPIGLPYAVVEVRAANPISSKFDLFGYVDVAHASWLGAAAMFSFLSDEYFPAGLSITQVFRRDDQGMPSILGAVFGPVVANDGTLKRAGGVALLANVRALIKEIQGGQLPPEFNVRPEKMVYLNGPASARFQNRPLELLKLGDTLERAFNR